MKIRKSQILTNYLVEDVENLGDHPIEFQFVHLLLLKRGNARPYIFSTVAALFSMVTLGPKIAIGFAEVPSLGDTDLATTIAASLGVDLAFLGSGIGITSFSLELASQGEVTGTSSRWRFDQMTIPLVGGVDFTAKLAFFDSSTFLLFFSSTFLASLDRVILFNIAAK